MGGLFSRTNANQDRPRNRKGGDVQVEYVNKKRLKAISQKKNAIRAGSTHDPDQRRYGYQSEGYVGTMYCVEVSNMKKEEDALLQSRDFKCNVHKRSNAQPKKGYIYAIVGKRNS